MGCSSSASHAYIGTVVVVLTPSDNLDVGSIELIHTLELTDLMFTRGKSSPTNVLLLPIPTLTGPITKMSVDFKISRPITVENGKIDIALTRAGVEVYSKPLFDEDPFELTSITYGCNTGNPVVNQSQAGDIYKIRITLN